MSVADSDAAHDDTFIVKMLVAPLRMLLRFPRTTLCVALILGALSTLLAVTRLGYKSGRTDLISADSDYHRLWLKYSEEFDDADDALVIVEGPGREQVVPVLREISQELAHEPELFRSVLQEVDLGKLKAKGLHYLGRDELGKIEASLGESLPIVGGEWMRLQIGNALGGMAYQLANLPPEHAAMRAKLQETLDRYVGALNTSLHASPGHFVSPWPEMPAALTAMRDMTSEAMLAQDGRWGFVLLRLDPGEDKLEPYSHSTKVLRGIISEIKRSHPDLKIGLTGLPVMEYDEMQSSQSSMFWASVISFVGVVIVIIAGFGGVRHALMANMVLLLGMSWAFAYATLAVGHLNILSVTFTATLIGVGIDYGTYYVARYLQIRGEGKNTYDAIIATSTAVGQSIITGALTTAVSFFAAAFTSFVGVAELGLIAGGGLILCAIAQLYVLPVCLLLWDDSKYGRAMPAPFPVHLGYRPFWRRPKTVALLGMAFTLACGMGLEKLWYDYNLLNLQANDLESVAWEKKLLTESGRSVWYAISIADSQDELLRRREAFLKLPSVERTEEIVSLLPERDDQREKTIDRISQSLSELPERPPLIAVDLLDDLGRKLGMLQAQLQASPGGAVSASKLEQIREQLRRLPPAECYERLSGFQQHAAGDMLTRLHVLKDVSDPHSPEFTDLPKSLVQRFVTERGAKPKYLLKIYGRGDLWNIDALSKFVSDVRRVDPQATGNPLQAYEASHEMKRSFEQASYYALAIIIIVLWLDFRSVKYSLLAALPLIVGMIETFGLLGWINQPLNPANMIALPLVMGIGIDYGVHIVHNFMERPRGYRMTPATALAVTVDSLTTLIGFGSLLIASHQGLQSLGRVLTIGIALCTFTSLILLPCLLTMIGGKPEDESDEQLLRPKDLVDEDDFQSHSLSLLPSSKTLLPPSQSYVSQTGIRL
ncbi:MAG: MMPL family transporter [Pirellulales bacterium]